MPQLEEAQPKYAQIAGHYRDLIVSGELEPGDEIPSERQIVAEWGVSRPTATRALSALRSEGLVESRQGSGTYVRARPKLNRRARDRYARARSQGKIYPAGEKAEIRVAEAADAPDDVAAALEIEPGSRVVRRKRVIVDEVGPVEVSTSWFRGDLEEKAPRLVKRQRIREGTLTYVERVTGRRGTTARDQIGARLATDEERDELSLGKGPAAVLVVHHVVLDEQGTPLEFAQAVYPPDRWTFEQTYPIPG